MTTDHIMEHNNGNYAGNKEEGKLTVKHARPKECALEDSGGRTMSFGNERIKKRSNIAKNVNVDYAQEKHVESEEEKDESSRFILKLKANYPNATNNETKHREPCRLAKCAIETPEGQMVCVPGRRRTERSMIERTKAELKRLENAKIIRRSESSWRSPIRPVEKPDGSIRVCTNLIALNDLVRKENYPTPIMSDLIEKVQGSEWFTLIDLKDGYFQVEIKEEDKMKTAFKFENMVYEWNRMPMGFKNAPSIFQKMMDKLLADMSGNGVEVYLDDIVVHGKTRKIHDDLVEEVFKRLEMNNLFVNVNKLQVAKKEIKLLGVRIDGKTQKLTHEARTDILEYPRPVDVKGLRRFLGKMNFYAPFIKGMSKIAAPLYEKTGKYAKFEWNENMGKSFKELKEKLRKEVCLYLPDYEKTFILETDASDTGSGACLMQVDEKERTVPVRWASRKLTKTEQNYGITEKELLAVV